MSRKCAYNARETRNRACSESSFGRSQNDLGPAIEIVAEGDKWNVFTKYTEGVDPIMGRQKSENHHVGEHRQHLKKDDFLNVFF